MSEFLKNLRREQDRRFDKTSRKYPDNKYGGADRQCGNYKRRPGYRKTGVANPLQNLLNENMPTIKNFLEGITDNQKRLAVAEQARAEVEERKADAMESIANHLKNLVAGGSPLQAQELADLKSSLVAEPPVQEIQSVIRPTEDDRKRVVQIIKEMRAQGITYDQIARHLEKENVPTFSGKGRWHGQTVNKLCKQAAA